MKKMVVMMVVFLLLTILAGCQESQRESADLSDAVVGILYSTAWGSRSEMMWLDENLNTVGSENYPFSGGMISFSNANVENGTIYMIPEGEEKRKDYGKAVAITPNSFEEIETGRINPLGLSVEGSKMVMTSNLNGECFIDLIDWDTKTVKSEKLSDSNLICTETELINGKIYSAVTDGEKNYIGRFDMESGNMEIIFTLSDENPPTYLERHGRELVYISDGKLVKYDTETRHKSEMKLSRNDALNINVVEDILWIAYTDYFDENRLSMIEARDYDSGEVLFTSDFSGAVLQMEANEENFLVRSHDMLFEYKIGSDGLTFKNSIECEKDGYYYGGFFFLNGK